MAGLWDNFRNTFTPEVGQGLLAFGLTAMDPDGGLAEGVRTGYQAYGTAMDRRAAELERQRTAEQRAKISEIAGKYKTGKGFDMRGFANEISSTGDMELIKSAQDILKNQPKLKKTINALGTDGLPKIHSVMDTGETIDTGLSPAERLSFQNLGNRVVGVNPYTGQEMVSQARGMTPDTAARLAQSASQFERSHALGQQNLALRQRAMAMNGASAQMGDGVPIPNSMEGNPMMGEFYKAKAREAGKLASQAENNLPGVSDKINQAIQGAQLLLDHPGFDNSVGAKAPYGYAKSFIPGSDEAGWKAAFDQMEGQRFLAAIEYMKGFGALTEREGQVASSALNRMKRSLSQKEFTQAAREYQQALADGLRKIHTQAGRGGEPINIKRRAPVTVPEMPQDLPQKAQDFSGFKIERVQ